MKIGTWNDYNVNLLKDEKGNPYWTVTNNDGKEFNCFNSPESFGHWMFHSGFLPDEAKEIEDSIVKTKLSKAKLMLKASGLSIQQLSQFDTIIKANAGLSQVKKTVTHKGKAFQQTFWVRSGQKIPESQLSIYTLTDEDITSFKKRVPELFLKIVKPVADKWYATTNLSSVGIPKEEAEAEAYLKAYTALMSYKMKQGGGAKLSTMVNTFIQRKFYNMYSTAKNRQGREVSEDRFETIDNTASIMDTDMQVEMRVAIENVKKALTDNPNIKGSDYVDLFDEWLDGHSLQEMADKRDVSRVAIASKFKRFIYEEVKKQGFYPPQTISSVAHSKLKFKGKGLSKAEQDTSMTRGWAYLYDSLSKFLGEEPEIEVNASNMRVEKARVKLNLLKALGDKVAGRREEKLLYRIIRNFDMFTLDFLRMVVHKYYIKDINGKGQIKKYGYSVGDNKIEVYDGDNLTMMQYNVVMALIYAYILRNPKIAEFVNRVEITPQILQDFDNKYFKEFSHLMEAKGKMAYAVFNTLLYMINKLEYMDNNITRFKRVQHHEDPKLNFLYHRIFEV